MNKTYYAKIEGIYCDHCRRTISSFIKKADSDASVKISGNIAKIKSSVLNESAIVQAVEKAGYQTKEAWIFQNFNKWKAFQILEILSIAFVILALRFLLKKLIGYDILNVIPVIDSKASLPALFIAGFLTSFHCIGMCGAINIAVSKSGRTSLLYNTGRLLCYTLVGGIAGALGKTLAVNQTVLGFLVLLLSFFMLAFGLSMAGIFSIPLKHLPHGFQKLRTSSAFAAGFLNGFMPCTPLVTMQLYAVSTASFVQGALSMLMFGFGTLPMMAGLAMFQNLFARKRIFFQKILAAFVILLGFAMTLRGLTGLGFVSQSSAHQLKNWKVAEISEDGKSQKIEIQLSYDGYENFAVKKGIPVEFVINAEEDYITGCNNRVISRDFNFDTTLTAGRNKINFLPQKKGTYIYSCWMYMLKNKIYVYED